jgi:glucoamylase
VLDNIGPNGTQVPGAGPGIVIASPSKTDPNCEPINAPLDTRQSLTVDTDFYTWSRDAALTLKTLVDEFIAGETALRVYIEDYIRSQAILQTVTNPSGTLLPAGTGLGEPKYNADGSRFNGNWGRPQRDGPALRATVLITYANYLVAHGEAERVKTAVWPVIANDLSYVGQYWYVYALHPLDVINRGSRLLTCTQELDGLRPLGGSVGLELLHHPGAVPRSRRGRHPGLVSWCILHRL